MGGVLLFTEGKNPSTDYYLLPLLNYGGIAFKEIYLGGPYPEPQEDISVIIVRYANARLISYLKKHRSKIKHLIYFMDDGLWDLKALFSLPPLYAWRLFKKAYLWKKPLLELGVRLWVSTDYLAKKYAPYSPHIIHPYPIGLDNPEPSQSTSEVLFYHGTSSHKKEIKWLAGLYKHLSSQNLLLEVVLDDKNYKLFKGLPNLLSFRPMSWKTYLSFSAFKYRTLGLVPLFDEEFNRGRSWVKFYDITRSGAVGIYSEHAPYSKLIRKFGAGEVLPMDTSLWKEHIRKLLSEDKRKELWEGALSLLEHLRQVVLTNYELTLEKVKF